MILRVAARDSAYREQFGRFAVELLLFNVLLISMLWLRLCSEQVAPIWCKT